MREPFTLTVLSEDGYQVFAALHREYGTLAEAIAGAKEDYVQRYGGHPAFRVYHAEGEPSGSRHVLIEVCFDETKRRSFVALYKVLQEVEAKPTPTPTPARRPGPWVPAMASARRIARWLVALLGGGADRGLARPDRRAGLLSY